MQKGDLVKLRPQAKTKSGSKLPGDRSGRILVSYRRLKEAGGAQTEYVDVDFGQNEVLWGEPASQFIPA